MWKKHTNLLFFIYLILNRVLVAHVYASSVTEEEVIALDEDEATTTTTTEDVPIVEETVSSTTEEEDVDVTKDDHNDGIAEEKSTTTEKKTEGITIKDNHPIQTGPLIDLFGTQLLSLEMVDETNAELKPHFTTDALRNAHVIGVYFSADWCGPCRQFTPELVNFYNKMNNRRGKKDQFEIVWVSRCRDVHSYGQYFAHMGGWYALPPEEAMGQRGAMLSDLYKVKSIPTLVLLDELGNVITRDGRNKIPQDKAGIGFPWRNPLVTIYMTLIPKTIRLMVKKQLGTMKNIVFGQVKHVMNQRRKKNNSSSNTKVA